VERPEVHRAIVEDITLEQLGEILLRTPRGTLFHKDELSGLFGGMDSYRESGASKDRSEYLSLYDGGPHRVDRVRRGALFVPNWGAGIVGGIQPEPMRKIASKLRDDGLLQRFNVVMARDAEADHDRPRNTAYFDSYSSLAGALYDIEPGDTRIRFDSGAQDIWEIFGAFTRGSQCVALLPRKMRTHLGKWRGQFARYSLMLHVIKCADSRVHPSAAAVSVETAQSVSRLFMNYLLQHALTFYTDVLEGSELMDHVRWLAGFVLARGLDEIDRRRIRQSYRALRRATNAEIHAAMESLSLFGWCLSADTLEPYRKWQINPAVHAAFKAKAEAERSRRADERKLPHTVFHARSDRAP
jgi:hypothetical protein